MIECSNYQKEQRQIKFELNVLTLNFKYLMKTQQGLINVIKYLESTWVATRRWQLNLIDYKKWQQQGSWGEIDEEIEE